MVLVITTAIAIGVVFGLAAIGFQLWVLRHEDGDREPEWSPAGRSPGAVSEPPTATPQPKPAAGAAAHAAWRQSDYDMEDFPAENW